MSGWKEENGGYMSDVMLVKDVANHDTISCIVEGIFGVGESGDCIDDNCVVGVMRVRSSAVMLMEGALMRLTMPLCLKRMAAILGIRGWSLLRSK